MVAGSIDAHLERLGDTWVAHHDVGHSVAITAATNAEAERINVVVQATRLRLGQLDAGTARPIANGEGQDCSPIEHNHPGAKKPHRCAGASSISA